MSDLRELQQVKIARLVRPIAGRFLSSSYSPPRVPVVGETGIIVSMSADVYLVERVEETGDTAWLCEFEGSELESV